MNLLVFGLGMYVIGSHSNNYGTIFPSIIEFQKKYKNIEKLIFFKKSSKNIKTIHSKIKKQLIKHKINLNYEIKINSDSSLDKYLSSVTEPTVAIICLPDHLHYYYANLCLRKNINCMVVKPLTYKLDEAKQLNKDITTEFFHLKFKKSKILYGGQTLLQFA